MTKLLFSICLFIVFNKIFLWVLQELVSSGCFWVTVTAMASAALELMGFFLGLLGMLGTLVATVLPYWQISAHIGSNIVTAVDNMRGLWMECVYQSTGAFQCETYNSMLALPSDLQAARALMVISIVLSILAIAMATLGMQCTLCLESSGGVKSRVAGAGGVLFVFAGFLALVPVAWTTHEVVKTFYLPNVPQSMKYELGECLYTGLASALISMLGGGMLCVSCCEEQEGGRGRRHGGGYPYPVGGGISSTGVRTTSQTYRNPTLQVGGVNTPSRGQTLIRSASGSSESGTHGAQRARKPTAAGYDITGYVWGVHLSITPLTVIASQLKFNKCILIVYLNECTLSVFAGFFWEAIVKFQQNYTAELLKLCFCTCLTCCL